MQNEEADKIGKFLKRRIPSPDEHRGVETKHQPQ